jgi:hypothetical protein
MRKSAVIILPIMKIGARKIGGGKDKRPDKIISKIPGKKFYVRANLPAPIVIPYQAQLSQ